MWCGSHVVWLVYEARMFVTRLLYTGATRTPKVYPDDPSSHLSLLTFDASPFTPIQTRTLNPPHLTSPLTVTLILTLTRIHR